MSRILLVEDEILIRELAMEQLCDAGFTVTAARSGDEALSLIQGGDGFDLLFTDIRMPGETDGWELARQARGINPELPVIYATGFSDTDAEAVENGLLVAKPYLFDDVLAALDELGVKKP